MTIIKPLFKKGDTNDMNCYKPIALVPVLSKVYERVIYDRINDYFEKFNLFAKEQIGFRKNKTINMVDIDSRENEEQIVNITCTLKWQEKMNGRV